MYWEARDDELRCKLNRDITEEDDGIGVEVPFCSSDIFEGDSIDVASVEKLGRDWR